MLSYVLNFKEIDKSNLPEVGGKGANLGEMTKAGFPVPQGFCVTTSAFRTFVQTSPRMDELFQRLDAVRYDDLEQIGAIGQEIREHRKKHKQGEREAEEAGRTFVAQFSGLDKRLVARLVKLYRNLMGMREHHKFALVKLLAIYKRSILEEARVLEEKGVLQREEDAFYFTLEELISLADGQYSGNVQGIVEARTERHELNHKLRSPRVMTSEGEILTGKLRHVDAPAGALIGTPVSAGVVEGVARVILRPEDAKLNPGEILVAPYTDPGWTPLFTSVVGLVTEVGGKMTHGSVIAREYGIPAVVGIENVTGRIQDGAYIRVDGSSGYVQILG